MEAMSIESLLLSAWEEEGFVGKTRVPIGTSDVDALAIHAVKGKVRVGEAKVREDSLKVYPVDDYSLAWIESQPHKDFGDWLVASGDDWHRWLENLPRLWDEKGQPAVPWLLPLAQVRELEVIFCCNLVVLCDDDQANDTLQRAAVRLLRENSAVARTLETGLLVSAKMKPTVGVVTDLVAAVFARIEGGYRRRFADQFKDILRELHRYLGPALDRLPKDGDGQRLGTRKDVFKGEIRKGTVLAVLKAMGVSEDELRGWLVGPDCSVDVE
jgi:hypothetical protein